MKYADEILKEIENRKTVDNTDYIVDDGWEDYIRGKRNMTREEHLSKALDLMIEWAVDCGFSFENIPEEFELYEHDIEE